MQLWHVHSQDLSHSLHILSFSVPRGCCHPGSTPESLDADAPKATGSKTLFMAVLGSVGLFVTVVHYGFSMIHILVKGKWNAAVWSRLLLGSSVVDLSYYHVQSVNVPSDMSHDLLMPWHSGQEDSFS